MTAKQQEARRAILAALPPQHRDCFAQIADEAIALGYLPALQGVRKDYANFTHPRLKATLLKINADPAHVGLSMKFYALPTFCGIFASALSHRLAYWKKLGYKAQCFRCGKCDGTQGYSLTLPGGEPGFLCGFCLVPLPGAQTQNTPEIIAALRVQHAFFLQQAGL